MTDDGDPPFTVVDRRHRPVPEPERQRADPNAVLRRWAGDIVDLDAKLYEVKSESDPPRPAGGWRNLRNPKVYASIAGATSVRSGQKLVCTEEQRRRRLAKRLARIRQSLAHAIADAEACGRLSAFEKDNVLEDVEVIRAKLHTLLRDVLFNA
jgi:hypothetical protein